MFQNIHDVIIGIGISVLDTGVSLYMLRSSGSAITSWATEIGFDNWLSMGLQLLLKLNFHSCFFRVVFDFLSKSARVDTSTSNPFHCLATWLLSLYVFGLLCLCLYLRCIQGRYHSCWIFTTRKRSLGQGTIFRSMCQEFCTQGGCFLGGGASSQEGVFLQGAWWRPPIPPGWLLLQAVGILLECILVSVLPFAQEFGNSLEWFQSEQWVATLHLSYQFRHFIC